MAARLASPQLSPLLLLLGAAAVVLLCWALVLPPFQSPDEHSHFGYSQTLAERGALPTSDRAFGRYSTEQERAAAAVGSDQLSANLRARPEWGAATEEEWLADQASYARDDGGGQGPEGANTARTNPPLYYAYELVPYFAASGGHLFDRLYLMRLWSALLALVAVAATWALIGELLGRRPGLQLVGSALVALQPMATFVSASVNPDALLIAAFAVALWLGARLTRRGLELPTAIGLCGATALAILTKGTGYALVPAVLVALAVAAARSGLLPRVRDLRRLALPLLTLAVPVAAWLLYARLSDRAAVNQVVSGGDVGDQPGAFSYLWQFYLPHLPGQQPLSAAFPPLPAIDFWLEGGWGRFGWLEVELPGPLYVALGALTVALVAGGLVALLRRGLRPRAGTVAFLALVPLALLAGLHLTEYRMLGQATSFNQGRYLLPLLPLLGLAAAGAIGELRPRLRALSSGALVGFLLAVQLTSLAIVATRFHA